MDDKRRGDARRIVDHEHDMTPPAPDFALWLRGHLCIGVNLPWYAIDPYVPLSRPLISVVTQAEFAMIRAKISSQMAHRRANPTRRKGNGS